MATLLDSVQQLQQHIPYVIVGCFAFIGVLYVSTIGFSFVRLLFSLFILPGKSLRSFGPKGSWAVVTGASDGIGREFAVQLARAGFSVCLVSRTSSKLEALAEHITSTYGGKTRTLAMDFATNRAADYTALEALLAEIGDVAVLINNVGRSHDIPVSFVQTPPEEVAAIIAINCSATLRVTALVLPGMLQRRRGLVLTMGSFGGLLPTPLLATYSGSKAFLQQWSSALGDEVSGSGVMVELVQSYLVTSAMSKIRRASATTPNPRTFVTAVLARLGRSGGAQGWAYTSTPFWSHAMMQWALATFVGLNNRTTVHFNGTMHAAIRERALRKKAREAGKKTS